MISGYANILDVSSPVNSNIAILSYDFIIGENSTVLYEALSIGKSRKNYFGGFVLRQYDPTQPDGFYYIHQVEDLKDFISTESHADNAKKISTQILMLIYLIPFSHNFRIWLNTN